MVDYVSITCLLLCIAFAAVVFQTLEASGLNVTLEDVPNTDHFNIIEQLVDEDYHLTKVHGTQTVSSLYFD